MNRDHMSWNMLFMPILGFGGTCCKSAGQVTGNPCFPIKTGRDFWAPLWWYGKPRNPFVSGAKEGCSNFGILALDYVGHSGKYFG